MGTLAFVLLQWSESHSVMSDSLQHHVLYSPWNSPGQNTGVGSLSLLQGIFSTQGSNPDLPHCRQILYLLGHKRSPRILEWVAYHFSRGSSRLRNWTGVSCIAGRFFTNWAIREAVVTGFAIEWYYSTFCYIRIWFGVTLEKGETNREGDCFCFFRITFF